MVDKPEKDEKREENLESHENVKEPSLKLDRVKANKEDAKNIFKHMMPGKSSEKSDSLALKENPNKEEKFDPKKNFVADPEETSKAVANAIRKHEQSTGGAVYDNKLWVETTYGKDYRVANFLYSDEGRNSLTGEAKVFEPLRSGSEMALYNRIKNYAAGHDMTDPAQKITQEQIMTWSLQVNADEHGNVTIQEALLTAHNVMKALARSGTHLPENLKKDDPIRHIIEDCNDDKVQPGQPPGLVHIMRDKYQQKSVNNVSGQWLFDKSNPYSVFKPNAEDRDASTGSAYHFWVGSFAASTLGTGEAKLMIWGEGSVIKGKSHGNAQLGEQEKPWGGAGVKAWEQMPTMKWSIKS